MVIGRPVQQKSDEKALSEVIGFILLLGVIVAAVALWTFYVVPLNGREDEINQMNAVKDRFTDYKISLDSLWANRQNGVTLSSSFNLGTGGASNQASGIFLPLLKPISSSAVLSVKDTGDTMAVSSTGPVGYSIPNVTYPMSVLQYQSQNNYWIQQRYYYQAGGVFLSQADGSTYRVSPPISIVNNSDSSNSVIVVPVKLSGGVSIAGNGPVRVDSRLKALQPVVGPQKGYSVTIAVNVTDYRTAQMWMGLFNDTRVNGGITSPSQYQFGITNVSGNRAIASMTILGPNNDSVNPDVFLTVIPVEYSVTLNSIASGIS
jgi:hypothetical protein